jgi:Protein of unknown function (DUF1565)
MQSFCYSLFLLLEDLALSIPNLLSFNLVTTVNFVLAFTPVEIYADTYYLSSSGSDSSLGTSINQGWQTIAKANSHLKPGDTVFIAAGKYSDQIRPARSGISHAVRITYKALGDGQVILTAVGNTSNGSAEDVGAIALGGRSYVTVDGVNQYIRANPGGVGYIALGNFTNAQYNVVNSVYLDGSAQTAKGGNVFLFNYLYGTETESKYNVLSNSYVMGRIGSKTQYTEDTILVAANAHHNLIDGNTILNARHVALNVGSFTVSMPHHNVIRNNTIRNPEHTALQLYNRGPFFNLVEGNYISASGGKPVEATTTNPGNAVEYSGSETIFRYNVITKGGTTDNTNEALGGFVLSIGGEGSKTAMHNRIYNNTIVKNNGTPFGLLDFGTFAGAKMGQGVYTNNFIYGAILASDDRILVRYWDDNQLTNDRFVRNVFGNPGKDEADGIIVTKSGRWNLKDAINFKPSAAAPDFRKWGDFSNIYDPAPGFVDFAGDDFRLPPGNKYIDAGSPLTRVSQADAASSGLLIVDDSRFFQDGMGIPGVSADWIAVGTVENIVQINSINYANNSISLRKHIPRKKGDMVWLYARSNSERVLKGAAPDIGAYEAILSPLYNRTADNRSKGDR